MKTKANFETIKELPEEFVKSVDGLKNVKFTQIAKSDSAYFYKREANGWTDYEVFKRMMRADSKYGASGWEKIESCGKVLYPSATAFGYWAWSFGGKNAYERALQKYNSIA